MSLILVVEDELALRTGLVEQFTQLGHQLEAADSGRLALDRLKRTPTPDLLILDLGLPDIDGTQILETCQQQHPNMPILVLSARANESDIVLGFKLGTRDYVTKPFSTRVLAARVESLLARQDNPRSQHIKLGDLTVDFESYSVSHPTRKVRLTTKEFDILRYLHEQQGRPVSRNDLLDEVWGMDSSAGPRTVDTHIAALRKKIESDPNRPQHIFSQRGIGYKLVNEEVS